MFAVRNSLTFLAAVGLVSVLSLSACSKSDQAQTPPPQADVSQLPPPQGNNPAAPPSSGGSSAGESRSGGY